MNTDYSKSGHSYSGLSPQVGPANPIPINQVNSLIYPAGARLQEHQFNHVSLSDRLMSKIHWLD